jgi:hypothetical protein
VHAHCCPICGRHGELIETMEGGQRLGFVPVVLHHSPLCGCLPVKSCCSLSLDGSGSELLQQLFSCSLWRSPSNTSVELLPAIPSPSLHLSSSAPMVASQPPFLFFGISYLVHLQPYVRTPKDLRRLLWSSMLKALAVPMFYTGLTRSFSCLFSSAGRWLVYLPSHSFQAGQNF